MLETCLEKDSSYYVEFYVSLSEKSNYSSKMIGAYFSENEIKVNNSKRLKFTPQIKNESFVVDTLNWVKISGVYKAKGDEQFLIIGNFGKNKTKFDKEQLFAYYYLDDVCVRKIVEK